MEVVAAGKPATISSRMKPLGRPVVQSPETVRYLRTLNSENATVSQFEQWLNSEIGLHTVAVFKFDGKAIFTAAKVVRPVIAAYNFASNTAVGAVLSQIHCRRRHAVSEDTIMSSIGLNLWFFLRALEN